MTTTEETGNGVRPVVDRSNVDLALLWSLLENSPAPLKENGKIRIVVADDHPVVRQGLRMFFASDSGFEVVGEAADGTSAVELARQLRPDVVVMDLLMPELDGVGATALIRRELPNVEVVILTWVVEASHVVGAVRAGAVGYLLKDTDSRELLQAVRGAAAGRVQLAPEAAMRLMREMRSINGPESLTDRETDILRLLGQGLTNRDIAASLQIGEKTVKTHVSNILAKLGLQSRTQAALHAVRLGLVAPQGGNVRAV
ncbi:MAG TPA: response regulator transcription factor [Chloroflexota bacterium]|nr:response regulator transcription factor [Chloroflexota bacterium]